MIDPQQNILNCLARAEKPLNANAIYDLCSDFETKVELVQTLIDMVTDNKISAQEINGIRYYSVKSASAPEIETPVLIQPPAATAIGKDEYEIPAFLRTEPDPVSDYSDKPKAYQMLKYIEAHPGCTNREIMLALGMDPYTYCSGFIKPYLDFIRIDKTNVGHKVFTVTKPVDSFYQDGRKQVSAKKPGAPKNEASEIPQQPEETATTGALDAQSAAVSEVQGHKAKVNKTQVEHDHPSAKVRFAITSDKRIILMGLAAEDIELSEADSHTLIQFCGDIALATNVSAALANRMIDLETLGA